MTVSWFNDFTRSRQHWAVSVRYFLESLNLASPTLCSWFNVEWTQWGVWNLHKSCGTLSGKFIIYFIIHIISSHGYVSFGLQANIHLFLWLQWAILELLQMCSHAPLIQPHLYSFWTTELGILFTVPALALELPVLLMHHHNSTFKNI